MMQYSQLEQLVCRRYQIAEQLQIPAHQINLQALLQGNVDDLAGLCSHTVAQLKALLETPLLERWQLLERRVPRPAQTLRCALASLDGETINGHFSRCPLISVYDVSSSSVEIVALRQMPEAHGADDHGARVNALNDCQLLFVAAIGGPAAARVIRADIYPMKVAESTSVEQTLAKLQQRLKQGELPPWLKKIMGESWQMMDWSA
ncbi:NifB/NifX family molybdenum-iron cluster-binding protein [Celerinatantimonas yamalensis]|uniref:NifB/NifX family molybdenum-iron cluster-binding protein n=1 Tax=Celerinatantimonas yamalensis TaxID=559956 RepID=A0ABW9G3N1_9GAMM